MEAIKNVVRNGRKLLREARTRVLRRIGLLGGDWNTALSDETGFWEMALKDDGRQWLPEEYRVRMDPDRELQEELKTLLRSEAGSVIRILDVGAGPLTTLGRHWEGRRIEIVAVDPLADQYQALLQRLRITPPTTTIFAHGEKLTSSFRTDEFDLAYASNSLDHSYDPLLAIRQMLAVVKPGCHVYLWHFANEAVTESYQGLHQWNFNVRDRDFIVSDGRRDFSLAREFGSIADLACEQQFGYGKPVVIAKLRKHAQS